MNPWQSDPFPHAVIDGMWPPALLQAAAAEFPGPDDGRWESAPGPREGGKRWCDRPAGWGPVVKQVIGELRGRRGAGLAGGPDGHRGPAGGHARRRDAHDRAGRPAGDAPGLQRPPRHRGHGARLNVLLFLNEEWEKEWGGVLYLGEHKQVEVMPVPGGWRSSSAVTSRGTAILSRSRGITGGSRWPATGTPLRGPRCRRTGRSGRMASAPVRLLHVPRRAGHAGDAAP